MCFCVPYPPWWLSKCKNTKKSGGTNPLNVLLISWNFILKMNCWNNFRCLFWPSDSCFSISLRFLKIEDIWIKRHFGNFHILKSFLTGHNISIIQKKLFPVLQKWKVLIQAKSQESGHSLKGREEALAKLEEDFGKRRRKGEEEIFIVLVLFLLFFRGWKDSGRCLNEGRCIS